MSFSRNRYEQIAFWDDMFYLTEREKRFITESWAMPFAEYIFPAIDESPYEVLYSPKDSRPNTPVNIIIGALILKELNGLSDEEVVNALLFDVRYRVALHTTSFEEQPLSDRTLGRFRARCLKYLEETGIDLLHNTVKELSARIAELTEADTTLLRMDSLMIESNLRRLSRKGLIYETIRCSLKEHSEENELPEKMKHYLEPDDGNRLFYHGEIPLDTLIEDAEYADRLIEEEHSLIHRVLEEQTVVTTDGSRELRPGTELHSEILQSPYDTDATFRKKGKSNHIGYVANVVEAKGENGTVILDYQYECNTYSDSQFLKDTVSNLGIQNESVTIVADGAYSGKNNTELAGKNHIRLVTTNLTGKPSKEYLSYRSTKEFKDFSRFRNGVETIPSILRRCCRVDRMPVRGKNRTAFFFGCMIAAINVRKLCISL